ncbi:MFS transporter [Saliphagus sp. GCM10025334]
MVTDRQPDDQYGWVIVFAGMFAMVFTFGTPYSYGIFLSPFAERYGTSIVAMSTIFSIELFAFYAGAGVVGIFATRCPSRALLIGCGIVTAVLAPSLFIVETYGGLLVVFALLGGALGTVFVVLAAVVPQWFENRRGTATGVLLVGAGLSLFVLPPLWQVALAHFGVEWGFFVVVSVSAVTFLLAGVVCRRPPWVRRSSITTGDLTEWLVQLAGGRRFQSLFLGVGLAFAWYYVLGAYAIDLFIARGLTDSGASVAFGFIGGVSIASRLGSGGVADRIGYRRTLLAGIGCAAIGSSLLAIPHEYGFALAVLFLGIGLGATASLYIPVITATYSADKDTAVIGLFNVSMGIFALLAPPVGTVLVTYTDSFSGAIGVTFATTVMSIVAIWYGTNE